MRRVGVGLIGSQFVSEHPCGGAPGLPAGRDPRRRLAHARATPRPSPSSFASRTTSPTTGDARAARDRHGRRGRAQRPPLPDRPRRRRRGQARRLEKPLCLNLAEADRMIAACRQAGVKLMYAEELCFAPEYVRAQAARGRGRAGQVHAGQAVREARRPARRRTSGTSSAPAAASPWTWAATPSSSSAGCSGKPARSRQRLRADGHLRPRRQDATATTTRS